MSFFFFKGVFIAAYFPRLLPSYYVIPPNAGVTWNRCSKQETPERECPFQPARQGSSRSCTLPVTWKAWGPEPTGEGQAREQNACLGLPLWSNTEFFLKMPWQFNKNRKPEVKVSNDKWFEIVPRCLCKNGGGKICKIGGKDVLKCHLELRIHFLQIHFFPLGWYGCISVVCSI